ncbi:MAG: protein jag [Oscillospiraceae bacterium]|nr:protein jag [Oscillospiraceae bacterium]
MIKTMEKSGRTVDEALRAALDELGLDVDGVSYTYEIVTRPKSGFLGIGSVPAVVRVSYEGKDEPVVETPRAEKKPAPAPKAEKAPAPAPKAEKKSAPAAAAPKAEPEPAAADEDPEYAAIRAFLTGLLARMGVEAGIEISRRDNGGINVNLSGDGMGAIIGRRGETLDAIQHLTNYVVNRGSDKHMHISVDAENYRSKREESLARLAEKMAEKAIKYKRSMALEPMNSYERHVIHTALQNYEGVTTSSTGVEPNRRVVVSYVKPETPSNKPQSREWA